MELQALLLLETFKSNIEIPMPEEVGCNEDNITVPSRQYKLKLGLACKLGLSCSVILLI